MHSANASCHAYAICQYHGTPIAKFSYQDYANGASFFSKDAVFAPSFVILTDSDGLYNLPDIVLMLVTVTSIKDENWLIEELGKFSLFLKELCTTHRIQHFAIGFSKDSSACRLRSKNPDNPAIVKEADVTCIRLY